MEFFFLLVYICVIIILYIYIYKLTYCHIIMIINSKLVIGYDILKNISTKNWPSHTFVQCTKPHHIAHMTPKLRYGAV